MELDKITFHYKKFFKSPDVIHMSLSVRMAYLNLLFKSIDQKNAGYIPNNMDLLQRLSELTQKEWDKSKDKILKKFTLSDKGYYNETMLMEIEKLIKTSKKRAERRKENKSKIHDIAPTINIPRTLPQTYNGHNTRQLPDNKHIDNNDKRHSVDNKRVDVKKHKIQLYVENPRTHLESVRNIANQLTYEQCVELVGELNNPGDLGHPFTEKLVKEKLGKMENTINVETRYKSVYLTLLDWCTKEIKAQKQLERELIKTKPPTIPRYNGID